MDEQSLFAEALERTDPQVRAAFLDQACQGDAALRQRLERLLAQHEHAGEFLAAPAVPPAGISAGETTTAAGNSPLAGAVIAGRYKLLEMIGEGGMGEVWLAEQTEPVKRQVALKVIKAGMDSRAVLARFEAERQALALMDHPNIAKVLDGGMWGEGRGASPEGARSEGRGSNEEASLPLIPSSSSLLARPSPLAPRPYFVMELVKGQPITKYCDQNRLTPRQRLELFVFVCQAVQHAHQKGIIHRDLKPSNVMVGIYDGRPVVKVIDFGVAKAAGQKLTEKTLFTGIGSVVGTLEYMSPEQAQLDNVDIDTRSDIYSLGVLLYELLTGTTPLDRRRLKDAAFLEMLRVIREEDPPKPSTRLSELSSPVAPQPAAGSRSEPTTLASISAVRNTEPAKLTKLVRGELDWIVMKALEKDRSRRYETANGFAMDLQRYLADEPVQACPPSAAYRLRKFARRNRRMLSMAAALCLALFVGLGAVAGSIGWVIRDRDARQTRVAAEIDSILREADQLTRKQQWPEALVVAKRAEAVLAAGDANLVTETRVRQATADLTLMARLEAARLLESQLVEGELDRSGAELAYSQAFADAGVTVANLPIPQTADQLRSRTWIVAGLATALTDWARLRRIQGAAGDSSWKVLLELADEIDSDPWRRQLRSVCKAEEFSAKTLRDLADATTLGTVPPSAVAQLGRFMRDYVSLNEAVSLLYKAQEHHPDDFWINFDLAFCLAQSKPAKPDQAVAFFRVALALRPGNPAVMSNLGAALEVQGQLGEALSYLQKAIRIHPKDPNAHTCLGLVYMKQGKRVDAVASHEKAIEINPKFAPAFNNLGLAFAAGNQLDRAIECYNQAIALAPKKALIHANLGEALRRKGMKNDAIEVLQKSLELDPRNDTAHNNLGLTYADSGNWDKAIEHYKQAIANNPNHAIAHSNIGAALANHGNWAAAVDWHRKAIKLDPSLASAHYNLGNSLQKLDDIDAAVSAWKEAIRTDPKYYLAYNQLGVARAIRGDFDGAIDYWTKSLKINPSDDRVRGCLAKAITDKAKQSEAKKPN